MYVCMYGDISHDFTNKIHLGMSEHAGFFLIGRMLIDTIG